jgi:hypothetical protein
MPPLRLGRGRRWRRAGLRDRVAGARGRHVVPISIKINMRRTRWILRRRDVSASALRAANISLPCSLFVPFLFSFLSFPFCVKGFFFLPPGFWVLHVQYHPITHKAFEESARTKRSSCFFFFDRPPFPSSLHVMTSPQAKPHPTCTYISPSHCVSPPNRQLRSASLYNNSVFFFSLSF